MKRKRMMAGLLVSAILYYTMGTLLETIHTIGCTAQHCTDEVLTGKSCTVALDGTGLSFDFPKPHVPPFWCIWTSGHGRSAL